MLELYNVKKIYQTKTRRVAALDSVSFTLPEKGLVFILGRSGSGKTTMLNMLGGLDAPTEGELIVDGVSSRDFRQADFDNYRNRYVGFVFQEYHLLDDYTVADNIALALELQGDLTQEERQQKIAAALSQVDLTGYGDRNTGELSGGQKQRVAIARALVKDPPMILADEPTGALDRKTGRQLFDLLKAVSKDKLVVVVSHDEDFAHEYADRILELEEGKIISDSAPVAKGEEKQATAVKLPRLGLSLKSVLTRGKITLRRKKWQISVISLLCVVSFLLMGVSDMLTSYDWKTTLISSLADEGVRVVPVTKESYLRYNMTEISDMLPSQDAVSRFEKNKFGMSNAKPGWQDGFLLRNADIQQLVQDTGRLVKGVYRPSLQDMSIEKNYTSRYFIASGDAWKDLYAGSLPAEITGFMELEASNLEALGCTLVAGRLPDGDKKEIAISKYLYDAFALVGYKDYDGPIVELNEKRYSWDEYLELVGTAKFQSWAIVDSKFGDGNNYDIQKMEDMLGKTIFFSKQNFTIVGVVDTGFDSVPYAALTANDLESGGEDATTKLLVQELKQEKAYGMACLAFVGQGKIEALQKTNLTSMTLPNMTVSITDGTDEVTTHTIIQENELVKQLLTFSDGGKLEVIGIAVPDAFSDRLEAERGTIPPHLMENPDLSLVWKDGHITFKTNPSVQSANWKFGTMQYQYIYPFDDGIIVSEYLYNLLTEGRDGTYTYAIVSAPEDRAGIAKLVDDCYAKDGDVRYPMQGIVASQLNNLNNTLYSIAALFSRIDAVLVVFTMLLFTGYIFISIAQQKQAIGIMRALGAGIRDVFSIYFMEGILIAVIGCVASVLLLVVLTPVANLLLQDYLSIKLSLLTFGFRQMLAIVLLSFGIAFVASIIPILRIARQKPVDAIRKN
jgi:ABC-type lipoprotein export system ATPase subunit